MAVKGHPRVLHIFLTYKQNKFFCQLRKIDESMTLVCWDILLAPRPLSF